jgi:pyrroloquinoline quinone biosynthesis protein B
VKILVLGSAAGGGLPQWNCRGANSAAARSEPASVIPRTQSSLAVSADGHHWALLNASPDLGQQIRFNPQLQPAQDGPLRNSPVRAAVLTNADVDHIAGLLNLREGHAFGIHATPRILSVLAANPIFNVLNPAIVPRVPLHVGEPVQVLPGLTVTAFNVPGKIALYLENEAAGASLGTQDGDTIGLEVSDGRSRFHYIPGCARIDDGLKARLRGSPLLFLDGTLFTDDEMIAQGLSHKTGQRMGHISMSGPDGSLAALADSGIGRRVYIHINNSNPVLREGSPERADVNRRGWEIAFDGMELSL